MLLFKGSTLMALEEGVDSQRVRTKLESKKRDRDFGRMEVGSGSSGFMIVPAEQGVRGMLGSLMKEERVTRRGVRETRGHNQKLCHGSPYWTPDLGQTSHVPP
ncbi:hypothetical protein ElyMa_006074800 [Elysia marginata]|uniref:Uncharacterized protein n=1 Tax=Elysia marginata TaxID=1093978 RepID=A0AAV4GQF1_9GAST|nr:hypothetical protein ElyMa_006074800 [Elysia marginata]